ncbi:glycosyltransferase [Clostridium beijerinckii]|uniref:glycosyltransferase n=1 Tax=Clostridium beijerinckii TaxID=1520 RepID=UPI00222787E4|nr:glycosyltransferase [Clostridium beijerinckii]UYZ34253.1 glycosyltransferase [Clostridium beijerinckii]
MSEPLVSIIIPVYNGENYLKEAINSALAQSYKNVEVIVVNDGSRDNGATEKIALSYGEKIRYLYKENGGVATALNLGIKNMKGEYFSWLSHDDIYYSNKIEKNIKALYESGNMTAIVQSDYDLLEVESNYITHVSHSEIYPIKQLTNSVFPVLQGLIHGCSLLIHKSHFNRIGIFSESLITTQDYDLWFRMMRYEKTIYIPEPLILSRVHKEQGSRTITTHDAERCQLHIDFLEKLTNEEICCMYGTNYNFYHRMCCFFKGGKMEEAYRYANQKLQETDIPENLTEKLSSLNNYIKELSNGQADRICIFCAGEYGVRLYQELRSKLIFVDWFSDNNPEKCGYLFDNIYCISPEKLKNEKEHVLVIVATRTPNEIVNQLKSQGFLYVTTKQELDKMLINTPPIKWITALDSIENLDYSSEELLTLIGKFNQTIFDICKYYEDRV